MRDRSQQVYFNSGLLSPRRDGLLETTPAEAPGWGWLGQSGLGTTLPLSFADCRERAWGKNVPDCFSEVPPQVGPRPRCSWEDPWVVLGTHRPHRALLGTPMVLRQAASKTPGSGRSHHAGCQDSWSPVPGDLLALA